MTLIIANVVPQGLIFAADRNITGANLSVISEEEKVVKVGEVVACYAGRARIGGIPMCDWLRGFLTRRLGSTLSELGPALAAELELAFGAVRREQRGMIVHLGGFETGTDGRPLPVIWYVRDAEIQADGGVRFLGKFEARDELKVRSDRLPYFGDATGDEIRARLVAANETLPWAGFRQSWDLAVFGVLDPLGWVFAEALVVARISREHDHAAPTTLDEWQPFMRFSVLVYAAYFEAFYPPDQRPVGGGVDVETVQWPE